MKDTPCPKCGSSETIPDVRLIERGHANARLDLCATVYENPEAWVFKGPKSHRFQARVCSGCGYTEFYVEDPRGLLEASRKAGR